MPYSAISSLEVFRPQSARVTTAKRLPCVRVEGTWFSTGGAKGSAMTVGGLGRATTKCTCRGGGGSSAGRARGPSLFIYCALSRSPRRASKPLGGQWCFFLFRTEFLMSGPTVSCLRAKIEAGLYGFSNVALLVRLGAAYISIICIVYVYGYHKYLPR